MKKPATTLTLVMLNIAAIGSLNNLPSLAIVGLSSISYYVIAMVFFFLPYSLVVAELASGYKNENGIYVWVKEAFGPGWGFTAAWLQWIENLFWYPTILSFVAATLAQLFDPTLASSKIYNLTATLGIYWTLTIANLYGIRATALISLIGSSLGIIIPGILLILCGIVWYSTQHPVAFTLSWQALTPDLHQYQNLALIVGIAQTLAGLEISAVHTPYVRKPQQAYPLATFTSTLLVLISSILGSLAIASMVPAHLIDLNNGVTQTFTNFLGYFHVPYMGEILIALMALGGMTAASAWISGPSASLAQAAEDNCIPPIFKKINSAGVSLPILVLQGLMVTIFSSAFIIMPTVSGAYWLLTVIAGQLYLVMYLIMFAAAMKLRAKKSHAYAYKIKGVKTTWLVSIIGSAGCFCFIIIGFLPPPSLGLGEYSDYFMIQSLSIAVMLILPPLIYYSSQYKVMKERTEVLEEVLGKELELELEAGPGVE